MAFADALYLWRARDLSPERQRRLEVVAAAVGHYDFAHELLQGDGPWTSDTSGYWI